MISFQCRCGKTYKVEDRFAGRETRCGQCGCDIIVPVADVTQSFTPASTEQDVTSSFADGADIGARQDEIGPTESYVPIPQRHTPTAANDATVEFTPTVEDDTSQNHHDASQNKHASPQNGRASSQAKRETSNPASTTGSKNPRPGDGQNFGCHQILRTHARGGMGQVSIARDEHLKREVALKELFEHTTGRKDIVRRFFDEAEITARLEHPGIVPVHAFGLDGHGRPFYTMKLVRGKTFQEAIKEHHALPAKDSNEPASFRDLVRRFASVCQTMSFAHDKGIIHRDLKPANIMLGEHGETLVMDWGLAKPYSEPDDGTLGDLAAEKLSDRPDMTAAGKIVGTPAYMSPEQAAGDQRLVGPQSDVYSLGAILYQILTGQLPYTGKSSLEIVQKVLNEEPQPSTIADGVPKGLEAICLKAMAREQRDRYFSAAAMFRDVTNWLDDEPISAKKDNRWDKTWRWIRKNRTSATILLLAAFTLLIVLGASGMMLERARAKTIAMSMLVDEMKRRVAEKEKELADKTAELAVLQQQYASLAEDAEEREELKTRIDAMTGEIAVLEQELAELRALAAELAGDTNQAVSGSSRAKIVEQEMTKRLTAKLAEAEKKWQELIQVSAKIKGMIWIVLLRLAVLIRTPFI